jgi:hypothetical protein
LLTGLFRGARVWLRSRHSDPEHAFVGAALIATLLANMFFIATAGVDPMIYMLTGMLSSYWWLTSATPEQTSRAERVSSPSAPQGALR